MKSQVYTYTLTKDDLFENILKDERLLMNHVVVEPGKIFPKHPTDAMVYIIILEGELSVAIENQEEQHYTKGQVLHVKKGIESTLGNRSTEPVELIVVKL